MHNEIIHGDSLEVLRDLEDGCVNLIYTDPPFNTGKTRRLKSMSSSKHPKGNIGFGGERYKQKIISDLSYQDIFESRREYLIWIRDLLVEFKRVLAPDGSLLFHIGTQESHYCKILLDLIFGEECYLNEICWSYDYGGKSKTRWSQKHDIIFWYVMDPKKYTFNFNKIKRIPYMAPKLVGEKKRRVGKIPTDVHWSTIVPTNSKEKTGYPTQKPESLLSRLIVVHSNEQDLVGDFMAGSGTIGSVAGKHNREFICVDRNPDAISIMATRLSKYSPTIIENL